MSFYNPNPSVIPRYCFFNLMPMDSLHVSVKKKNPRSLKYIGIFKDLMFLKPVGSLAVASSRWAFVIPELTGVHFHWENLKGG